MQEEIIQNEDIENKRDLPIAVEVPEVIAITYSIWR